MSSIVYQDEFCLLVNKPNDVLVHHAHHSRNKIHEESLVQWIAKKFNTSYYPIHRLDRKTSGLVLFAKDKSHVSKFQELFTTQQIQKTYHAIARGFPPSELLIDSPVKGRDTAIYKDAETQLKTLAKIELKIPVKPYNSSRYSLVKLQPKTGRLHQLRIHMNKISHPIIGDPKYGDKNHNLMFEREFKATHLFLHASDLEFVHPFTQDEIKVKADFPDTWLNLFKQFNWQNPIVQ